MTDDHGTAAGVLKVALAWAGMIIGTVNVVSVLSTIALVLTIVFTSYQIQKIRRDLARQDRLDKLEEQLRGKE